MKHKFPFLLSSIFLICSCASRNAPQEIIFYLNACSLKKAKEETKTIVYTLENTLSEKEKEKGKISLLLEQDDSKEDFYQYKMEEYTGSYVTYNSDVSFYVTKREKFTFLKEGYYFVYTTYTGYEKDSNEIKVKTLEPVKYLKENIYDLKNGIYASSFSQYQYQGGVYYADFMSGNLSYYPYMSIKENHFFLELKDYPFKNDTENGIITQTIEMNSLGLLESLSQEAKNLTTYVSSVMNVKVKYNQEIIRKEMA